MNICPLLYFLIGGFVVGLNITNLLTESRYKKALIKFPNPRYSVLRKIFGNVKDYKTHINVESN